MTRRARLFAPLLAIAALVGSAPAPAAATVGSSRSFSYPYSVVATGTLNRALTTMRIDETLTITAPDAGLDTVVLAVEARGLRAWTTISTAVDGVPTSAVSWTGTIGLTFDLSASPWAPGSTHTLSLSGLIDWTKSTDLQGHLRRIGSGTAIGSSLVLTAGDQLPLPIERAYYPTFSDAVSAFPASSITFTLVSPVNLPTAGVAMAGTRVSGTTASVGRTWTYRIENARSYAIAIGMRYGRTSRTIDLPSAGGGTQPVVVSVFGATAAGRAADLSTTVYALQKMSAKFGAGPYADYKVIAASAGGFSHEFPGAVFLGNSFTGADRIAVVRHEVAHQWFYALVANDQAADGWMDESLATFSENRIPGYTKIYRTGDCSRPIDGPNRPTAGYYSNFFRTNGLWECVYLRGNRFWMTIGQTIGFTKLEGCLRDYVQANRFSTPGPVVLAQALADCDARVLAILNPSSGVYPYLSKGTVDAIVRAAP